MDTVPDYRVQVRSKLEVVLMKKGDWVHSQVALRTYEKKMKFNTGLFRIAFTS